MEASDEEVLKELARKYIWWKSPEEALLKPQRIIAQVMNIGDYDDVQAMAGHLGDEALRQALATAEPGQFNDRSWAYWHYRLGRAEVDKVPPQPARTLA
jgi:hypothetical protein